MKDESISKKEKSYFNAARAISKLSDHRCKLGCIVVKGHKIISSGYNSQTRCHGRQAEIDKKYFGCECKGPVHAEFDALNYLMRQRIDLSDAELYLYRELSDGSLALSRPCPRCMSLIRECGIRKIKYTGQNSYICEVLQ